jgi:hypothetical protein
MEDAVLPGFSFDDSVPVTGDQLDGTVRWKNGESAAAWAGKPVRLHFRLAAMRVYGFQFLD